MSRRRMRGFSLLEMMAVLAIALIVSGIAVMSLQPALKASRVRNSYNIALAAMRQARDTAVAQRQVYYVTFSNAAVPNTITITQGGSGVVLTTYTLPPDVQFNCVTGIPTGAGTTPDGFGAGATPIDFDQGVAGGTKNIVYFQPDGSAQDINSNLNNGVIYIARPSELYSSYAITVWGATGRVRGWRMIGQSNVAKWVQQ